MSLTLLILKINTTFEDVQMMLKWFFDFSTGFRFSKISVECSVHICSCLFPLDALYGFMSNTIKKSWTVSSIHSWFCHFGIQSTFFDADLADSSDDYLELIGGTDLSSKPPIWWRYKEIGISRENTLFGLDSHKI